MGNKYTVLELNENALKIVVGKRSRHKVQILSTYRTTIPEEARDTEERLKPEVFAPFLRDLFAKLGIRNKHVLISVINNALLTRTHEFPRVSVKDLLNMVRIYIGETFPVEVNQYTLDYAILKKTDQGYLVRINILSTETIENLYRCLTLAGMQPAGFIPPSGALEAPLFGAKTLNELPFDLTEPYALFEFQGQVVNLSLFQDHRLVFNRDIKADLSVDATAFLDRLISTYTEQFRALAQRDFEFKRPQRFFLSGTLEDPMHMREALEERLGKPVDVIRSIGTVEYKQRRPAGILTDLNAAGLLLSAPGPRAKKHEYFDFFHSLNQTSTKRSNTRAIVVGAVVITLVLAASYHLNYLSRLGRAADQRDELVSSIESLRLEKETSGSDEAAAALEATQRYHEQLLATTAFIENQPRVHSETMLDMVEMLPPELVLTAISVDPDRVFMNCQSADRESISQYEAALKALPLTESVFISFVSNTSSPENGESYTFTIDCTLKTAQPEAGEEADLES